MRAKLQSPKVPTRADIVAAALRWIGTPYRHQAAVRGAGCDCLGLVRGVWREVYGAEPEAPPPYSPDWGEAGRTEHILDAARRNMRELSPCVAHPGDVLVFRMVEGRIAKHMAIVAYDRTIIHAVARDGVRRVPLDAGWIRRAVAGFAFPGIENS